MEFDVSLLVGQIQGFTVSRTSSCQLFSLCPLQGIGLPIWVKMKTQLSLLFGIAVLSVALSTPTPAQQEEIAVR